MPGITIQITGDGAGASEALRVIEERMQQTAHKGEEMGSRLTEAGERVRSAMEMVGVGIGIREVIDGFKEMIASTMEAAVQIGHLSQQTGISTQHLSVLRYAAQATGVDFDVLTRGFKKLAITTYDADAGNAKAAKGFNQVGISIKDLRAKGDDMYGVLTMLADKFEKLPDGMAKSDAAAKIFGARMGAEMIPVLNALGGQLDELKGQAEAMGLVWDEAGIKKMEEMHKKTQELKGAFEGLGMALTTALAPAIDAAIPKLEQLLGIGGQGKHGNDFAAGLRAISDFVTNVMGTRGPGLGGWGAADQKALAEHQAAAAEPPAKDKPTGEMPTGEPAEPWGPTPEQEARWQRTRHLTEAIYEQAEAARKDKAALDALEADAYQKKIGG
jgi:hypothetical protein